MDTDLLTFSYLVASTLLGVVIGGVLQYYISKAQDDRRLKKEAEKKRELDQKRKVATYRRLQSLVERVLWRTAGTTERELTNAELEGIESTIAQNFDVLEKSTVAAWDTKHIVKTTYDPDLWVTVQCEAFWKDVSDHYNELKYSAIPPKS